MRDILDEIAGIGERGEPFALAIVTETWSSSPREVGAAMAVDGSGRAIGSVSGGCVEAAVYEVALSVLESGQARQVTYGVSDGDAFAVGLTCGGTISLHVLRVDESNWAAIAKVIADKDDEVGLIAPISSSGDLFALTTEDIAPSTGDDRLDSALAADARGLLRSGRSGLLRLGLHGERRPDDQTYLILSFPRPPRMFVFGAIDFARAVADIGSFLGFRTIVCDARATFATPQRFPRADEVIVEWPHRFLAATVVDQADVICVLTHDPKFDVPLLVQALYTPAGYIGVMGSRRTHDQRIQALRDEGITEQSLQRLRAPIGLDLGGRTPEETAVSIAAEIIRDRWQGSGTPLRELQGPIHRV